MKTAHLTAIVFLVLITVTSADVIRGLDIEFVAIAAGTNPTSGYGIVNYDYCIGRFEITNDQWNRFETDLGLPITGSPSHAYDTTPYWTGNTVPTNNVSWYEPAQFINWLKCSRTPTQAQCSVASGLYC